MDLYPWVVLTHVLAAFGFAVSHGVSAFAAFAIRRERDPDRLRALLDLSGGSLIWLYVTLLVVVIAGIVAALMHGWFGNLWPWVAIVVLVVVIGAMFGLATRYYATVRQAIGMPSSADKKGEPPAAPLPPDELARLLETRRPEAIALVGFGGLALLIWLMELKPF